MTDIQFWSEDNHFGVRIESESISKKLGYCSRVYANRNRRHLARSLFETMYAELRQFLLRWR